jgi:hypothetical protein
MKPLLTLLAIGLLSVYAAACGSSSKGSTSSGAHTTTTVAASTIPTDTTPAPVETAVDADKDNDVGAPHDDTNNDSVLDSGQAASPSEQRTITALVKRYYKVAAAEDGAQACSMIYSTYAEAIPEDYGQSPPGQPYMRGTTCPVVMSLFFKHFHNQIALELPKLKVARVRLKEHAGFAVLSFGALPERQIAVDREGHVWRIDDLLDVPLI